jgi:DNA-binding MarR family transcriptional regulator
MADIGLHPRHFALMNVIASQPGSAQQELVASTRIDPSSMVAVIDELEGLGLVERRPHPEDRRKRAVHLTPEGTKKLAVAGRAAGRLQGEFFAPLTDAEREQLHGLLRKLAGVEPAS